MIEREAWEEWGGEREMAGEGFCFSHNTAARTRTHGSGKRGNVMNELRDARSGGARARPRMGRAFDACRILAWRILLVTAMCAQQQSTDQDRTKQHYSRA